ncbi:MAG: excinuclease ABC subunit C [Bacteroidales bacterium]|nr:excinuclease ABC subunit C [Bacteroidales bacterium]MBN2750041.1 excinuclease ABC subunit C [Bacteroidales bacterium]
MAAISALVKEKVELLPHKPGVYQFFNSAGEIIYVGKAKDLRKRVSSYFNKVNYDSAKLRVLVSKISDMHHIVVETESDALLLENNLIKTIQPRYNVLLKDDKTYPWICVKHEYFPRVFSTRRYTNDGSSYFGPFTSVTVVRTLLELIRQLYPIRTCSLNLDPTIIAAGKYKACLEYQIGNCLAPCEGLQLQAEYDDNIKGVIAILKGNLSVVSDFLKDKMEDASNQFKFEVAQFYKEKLDILNRYQSKTLIVNASIKNVDVFSIKEIGKLCFVNYLKIINGSLLQSYTIEVKKGLDEPEDEVLGTAIVEIRNRVQSNAHEILVSHMPDFTIEGVKYSVPERGDRKKLLDLSLRNCYSFAQEKLLKEEKKNPAERTNRILTRIQKDFATAELPVHIECFDNSNLQGTNPVSSCVVFKNGVPSKRDYRHFIVKTVEGANDFATMQEVVYRRYSRLVDQGESLPQLIVIDGGKGQLSAAYLSLVELGIQHKVQIVGIAKRLEEIFFPGDTVPLYLDKNSESLKVIQHIRNEAHRFGITHHRKRRSKSSLVSELTSIAGVGDKTLEVVFKHFKSMSRIKSATVDELTPLVGKSRAERIFNHFRASAKSNSDDKF